MKTLIVGGHFGTNPKESKIISKLASEYMGEIKIINGGTVAGLAKICLKGFDLVLWFPDVDNTYTKYYPTKDVGSVLICSKVVREIYSRPEMISRIFKMHANAIILIKTTSTPFTFEFIDALNNTWGRKTKDIDFIKDCINNFYCWTRASKRQSLQKDSILEALVKLNRIVADKHEADMGRYFGNLSTRCMKMFPSSRFFFSRRNVDKFRITVDDMVFIENGTYYGSNKPSVDTPVQLELYKQCPQINYFIHGHSYIPGWPETEIYYPCGDLREVNGIVSLIKDRTSGIINLKDHGFLIYASDFAELWNLVEIIKFSRKEKKS